MSRLKTVESVHVPRKVKNSPLRGISISEPEPIFMFSVQHGILTPSVNVTGAETETVIFAVFLNGYSPLTSILTFAPSMTVSSFAGEKPEIYMPPSFFRN